LSKGLSILDKLDRFSMQSAIPQVNRRKNSIHDEKGRIEVMHGEISLKIRKK